jgi:cystathionine beta-lyase
MKKYNFDERIVRRGTNCVKWDEKPEEDIIPLWVADMDFRVAPAIQQAIERRAAHGVFGYTHVPEAYYEAIISWFKRRHQWEIEREDILYTTGVVPAISCCLKAITMPGEKVLILSPVYNCFFSSIRNNGCEVVEVPLNFKDFEAMCSDEKTTAFLLCNPHNPGGRVWTREELERMNDICQRHGVRVVSDEIHCELVMPGHKFVPFGTISSDAVVCNSPSKAFNIAGLQTANIICHDPELRRRINRAININEVCDLNPFGVEALMAAYNESEEWLDELCLYLKGNYDALCSFFAEKLPQLKVMPLEGTYLAWVDIRATGMSSDELADRLYNEAGVWVSSGAMYSPTWGEGFIRINMACPRSQLMEGLERIEKTFYKSPKFFAEQSGEAERGD